VTNAAIVANNLTFKYGGLKVIDDMSMEIEAGTSYGLLGPNGAGKTTLIRLMVGLLKPVTGSIKCLGKMPSPTNARLTGYMPQLPALYSELSVEQNIDFFASIYGLKDKKERSKRVEEVIKIIDLWPKRRTQAMKLSGGMKQRVSLGCAIVHRPQLIFLDEPTVGLDPELRVHF
jgi:ABC-2 type transport system ATP-binding protein